MLLRGRPHALPPEEPSPEMPLCQCARSIVGDAMCGDGRQRQVFSVRPGRGTRRRAAAASCDGAGRMRLACTLPRNCVIHCVDEVELARASAPIRGCGERAAGGPCAGWPHHQHAVEARHVGHRHASQKPPEALSSSEKSDCRRRWSTLHAAQTAHQLLQQEKLFCGPVTASTARRSVRRGSLSACPRQNSSAACQVVSTHWPLLL